MLIDVVVLMYKIPETQHALVVDFLDPATAIGPGVLSPWHPFNLGDVIPIVGLNVAPELTTDFAYEGATRSPTDDFSSRRLR